MNSDGSLLLHVCDSDYIGCNFTAMQKDRDSAKNRAS